MACKEIGGYENYLIYDDGRVWSKYSNKFLKQQKKKGYYCVNLCNGANRKTVTVHRLVAKAFLPNPKVLPEINHKDENKLYNSVSNLEWCTRDYNQNYGTRLDKIKRSHWVPVVQIKDGIVINEFESAKQAASVVGVYSGNITRACQGKRKRIGGYEWKYKKDIREE